MILIIAKESVLLLESNKENYNLLTFQNTETAEALEKNAVIKYNKNYYNPKDVAERFDKIEACYGEFNDAYIPKRFNVLEDLDYVIGTDGEKYATEYEVDRNQTVEKETLEITEIKESEPQFEESDLTSSILESDSHVSSLDRLMAVARAAINSEPYDVLFPEEETKEKYPEPIIGIEDVLKSDSSLLDSSNVSPTYSAVISEINLKEQFQWVDFKRNAAEFIRFVVTKVDEKGRKQGFIQRIKDLKESIKNFKIFQKKNRSASEFTKLSSESKLLIFEEFMANEVLATDGNLLESDQKKFTPYLQETIAEIGEIYYIGNVMSEDGEIIANSYDKEYTAQIEVEETNKDFLAFLDATKEAPKRDMLDFLDNPSPKPVEVIEEEKTKNDPLTFLDKLKAKGNNSESQKTKKVM